LLNVIIVMRSTSKSMVHKHAQSHGRLLPSIRQAPPKTMLCLPGFVPAKKTGTVNMWIALRDRATYANKPYALRFQVHPQERCERLRGNNIFALKLGFPCGNTILISGKLILIISIESMTHSHCLELRGHNSASVLLQISLVTSLCYM